MVVRTCAVDSGTLTLDTELARMSHCGFFYFDDRYSITISPEENITLNSYIIWLKRLLL